MAIPAISPYSMPMASDFPQNKVSWKANPKRSVLLIHDMQQYFLNAYTLGESPIIQLIENIQLLKAQCTELGIPVVYTAQPGDQRPEDRALLQDFWGPGLADDPSQTKVIDEITPNASDTVLTKWRYSAFKRTKLMEIMQEQGRDQLIICGVYAHIGCLLTACDAFMQDVEAFFVCDAVADFSADHHKMAMTYAADRCAVTTSTTLLLDQLKSIQLSPNKAVTKASLHSLTQQLVRQQVAELLGESSSDIDDNEDLIDRGLDSIRIMSLVETWRSKGADVTFVKLAAGPTISAWWNLLSAK
ncbi:isochorismatase [Pelosinus baikalensis]|uniref:isochorismatase n=1 Tax=Pelosinus baikalensis TaxID=2892015 RepID=A0ABS8HUE4_9FIRM|nr:isochorismatase [Pelosinus baikalensis]MCC5466788.1 isochorismatase [Pelosinus baikalensis]